MGGSVKAWPGLARWAPKAASFVRVEGSGMKH